VAAGPLRKNRNKEPFFPKERDSTTLKFKASYLSECGEAEKWGSQAKEKKAHPYYLPPSQGKRPGPARPIAYAKKKLRHVAGEKANAWKAAPRSPLYDAKGKKREDRPPECPRILTGWGEKGYKLPRRQDRDP